MAVHWYMVLIVKLDVVLEGQPVEDSVLAIEAPSIQRELVNGFVLVH